MPRISTDNYDTVASWNGSQDLFIVEQPDGTKVATPAQIKQYVLGNSIDDIYSVMGQMGAKNLIPYPYADGEYKSYRNMTYTVNTDGTITATATQALTGDTTFYLYGPTETEELVLKAGVTYVLSGDPTASGVERIVVNGRSAAGGPSETLIINNTGVPKKYTPDVDKVITSIYIRNYAGASMPIPYNETFKPMLRLASDTDDTYQPYAKTNKELTEVIGDLTQTGLTGDSVAEQLGNAKNYVDNAVNDLASKFNWKVAGSFSANGDITLENSLENASEIMITLVEGLPRQTVLIESISRFKQYNLFPDFMTYGGRIYARITYVDDTHVTISQLTGLGSYAQLIIEIR